MRYRKLLSFLGVEIISFVGISGKNNNSIKVFDFLFYTRYNGNCLFVPRAPSMKSFCMSTTTNTFCIFPSLSFFLHIFSDNAIKSLETYAIIICYYLLLLYNDKVFLYRQKCLFYYSNSIKYQSSIFSVYFSNLYFCLISGYLSLSTSLINIS